MIHVKDEAGMMTISMISTVADAFGNISRRIAAD